MPRASDVTLRVVDDPKNRACVLVHVPATAASGEGRRQLRIFRRDAESLELVTGMDANAAHLRQLVHLSQVADACLLCIRWINRRALSVAEARARLSAREFTAEVILAAIERLEQAGYLSDATLAGALAAELSQRGPVGPARLEAKLGGRGIGEEVQATVVSDSATNVRSAAGRAQWEQEAASRLKRMGGERTARNARRLLGYFARQGLEEEAAREIVARLIPLETQE